MSTTTATYQAVGFTKFGKTSTLLTVDLPTTLEPTEILIRVVASSLNPVDAKRRDGAIRLFVPEKRWPALMCYDVSGIVEKIGSQVTRIKVGDRVAARVDKPGTLAEKCVAEEAVASIVPADVDLETIAGLPLAGQTVFQMMELCGIQEGSSILISGGAGGLGSFGVQLAKHHYKCGRVVATCSAGKSDLVRSLGADEVLNYQKGQDEFAGVVGQFDVLIDTVGVAPAMLKAGKKGALCQSAAYVPTPASFPDAGLVFRCVLHLASFLVLRQARSLGVSYGYHVLKANFKDLDLLIRLVSEGKIRVLVDERVEGLGEFQRAFDKLETGRASGKIVVVVGKEAE